MDPFLRTRSHVARVADLSRSLPCKNLLESMLRSIVREHNVVERQRAREGEEERKSQWHCTD